MRKYLYLLDIGWERSFNRVVGMEIRSILQRSVGEGVDEPCVRELVALCRSIALAFLRKKVRSGRFYADYSHLNIDDLSWDAIADLFNRDDAGTLVQVKAYFDGIDMGGSSEEALLSHLRRLVFSRVNQAVFRIYGETDPGLSKIIRNIKLAIQSLQHFTPSERFGEQCLVPALCDPLAERPRMEQQELGMLFRHLLSPRDTVPAMLAKVSRVLREQSDYSRVVPVIGIAQLFRSVYESPESSVASGNGVEERLSAADIEKVVKETSRKIREEYRAQYVVGKEVRHEEYEGYFTVIEESLLRRFVGHDGHDFTLFQGMNKAFPRLTKEEYAERHKARLEYLLRLVFKRSAAELHKGG